MKTIFAIEMCLRFDADLHRRLHELVVHPGEVVSYGEKWQRYSAVANLLQHHEALWHRGCWDYWDQAAKAESDFAMWVNGMLTREGSRREPSGQANPYRGGARFLTLTMATVILAASECNGHMMGVCNVPQGVLWQPATFKRILAGMRHLNFASIEKDTMYLIPRDPDWALTEDDLTHTKFEYLRSIV